MNMALNQNELIGVASRRKLGKMSSRRFHTGAPWSINESGRAPANWRPVGRFYRTSCKRALIHCWTRSWLYLFPEHLHVLASLQIPVSFQHLHPHPRSAGCLSSARVPLPHDYERHSWTPTQRRKTGTDIIGSCYPTDEPTCAFSYLPPIIGEKLVG